jgi:hypothetical protein
MYFKQIFKSRNFSQEFGAGEAAAAATGRATPPKMTQRENVAGKT